MWRRDFWAALGMVWIVVLYLCLICVLLGFAVTIVVVTIEEPWLWWVWTPILVSCAIAASYATLMLYLERKKNDNGVVLSQSDKKC
jgi:hypothetical protein